MPKEKIFKIVVDSPTKDMALLAKDSSIYRQEDPLFIEWRVRPSIIVEQERILHTSECAQSIKRGAKSRMNFCVYLPETIFGFYRKAISHSPSLLM